MSEAFAEAARRFGATISLTREGGLQTHFAFMQPLGSKGELPSVMTPLGAVDQRQWLYLGEEALVVGEQLLYAGLCFTVRECAPVQLGQQAICQRAVLRREKEMLV